MAINDKNVIDKCIKDEVLESLRDFYFLNYLRKKFKESELTLFLNTLFSF